jgi:hypothetical protein
MTSLAWPRVGSIHAIALRLSTLDATGAPVVGAKKAFVSLSPTKFSFASVYADGSKIEQKNGADQICVTYQGPRSLTGATGKLEVCSPDPELEQLLTGAGVLVNSAADVVGGSSPAVGTDPTPYGASLELWTRAILNGAVYPTLPYIRWVFGCGKFSPEERTAENANMSPSYSGVFTENTNLGNGAFDDWDYASNKLYQYALDTSAHLPTTAGYVTVPTQVP